MLIFLAPSCMNKVLGGMTGWKKGDMCHYPPFQGVIVVPPHHPLHTQDDNGIDNIDKTNNISIQWKQPLSSQ